MLDMINYNHATCCTTKIYIQQYIHIYLVTKSSKLNIRKVIKFIIYKSNIPFLNEYLYQPNYHLRNKIIY